MLRLLGSGVGGSALVGVALLSWSSSVGPPLPFLFSFCLMLVYVFDRKNYVKKGFLLQRRTLMHYKMGEVETMQVEINTVLRSFVFIWLNH